jgi:hypothetical protein
LSGHFGSKCIRHLPGKKSGLMNEPHDPKLKCRQFPFRQPLLGQLFNHVMRFVYVARPGSVKQSGAKYHQSNKVTSRGHASLHVIDPVNLAARANQAVSPLGPTAFAFFPNRHVQLGWY